jgi:hypothetical protein
MYTVNYANYSLIKQLKRSKILKNDDRKAAWIRVSPCSVSIFRFLFLLITIYLFFIYCFTADQPPCNLLLEGLGEQEDR